MRAGLLGLGRGGQQLADALLRSSWCELVCVGSLKPDRLEKLAAVHPGVNTHNDYRLALISRPLDVVFFAIPPFQRPSYLKMAADRRIPVWMLSPPVHRYDELVDVVEHFERAEVPIAAARTWRSESALRPQAVGIERWGPLSLAEGRVSTCWSGELGWRGDSAKAGGGVLLDRGYLLLDAIVQLLGAPSSVLAGMARSSAAGTHTRYDTEDTAAMLCRYASGSLATLTATRRSGPDEWTLRVSAPGGSMTVTDREVSVREGDGSHEILRQQRSLNPLAEQVDDFLGALQTSPRSLPRLREHLPTMAVMQAAYLSARTGHPETPATISDMHRV